MDAAVLTQLENELRMLLKGEHSCIHLSFNDVNAINYETVENFETEYTNGKEEDDWVSEEEKKKGYATNSKWRLQWYPDTPVGFYSISASSLPALFNALQEHGGA